MERVRLWMALTVIAVSLGMPAFAQNKETAPSNDNDTIEHAFILEVGLAGDWSATEGAHPGGTLALEITPIEHWLEMEIGVTAIHAGAGTELPVDVLFKKPWQLAPRIEFMIGAGPELVHATGPVSTTYWGFEGVLDFMFWSRQHVGWYVEPAYEATMRDGSMRHGAGIATGLLIGR